MKVNNYADLRIAYDLLGFLNEEYCDRNFDRNRNDSIGLRIRRTKQEIRDFYRRQETGSNSHVRIIKSDFDNQIVLITLPDFVDSEEYAEEYFMGREYIRAIPSQYDCTGQLFTAWYKIFQRNGRWMAYHCICMDV